MQTLRTRIGDWFRRDIERPLEHLAGGRARLKVIVLLACVLGLDAADKGTVGAVAMQLKQALHIGDVQVGLLITVSTAVGALVTLPFGVLADRVNRCRVLVIAMVVWSLAMILNGASDSYPMLLLSRLLLGTIVAAANPLVISLTGDFFRPDERGRIFGYIFAGELVGVAFGFLLSGNMAAVFSWRAAFWALALTGLMLAWLIWRYLPEPTRGGQSFVPEGATDVAAGSDTTAAEDPAATRQAPENENDQPARIENLVASRGIQPHASQILHADPANLGLWRAVRHVWSMRTFRSLVIASALGYFYFTGLRTFALVYMRDTFDLGQAAASTLSVSIGLGAIVGAIVVGRIGDRLIRHGTLTGRIHVGAAAYLIAAAALLLGLLGSSLYVTCPLFFVAAIGIGGANPAVDAARLDVVHSGLWGRAEGVRATLRFALEAAAAPLFGFVAAWFGHARSAQTTAAQAVGLRQALMIMLVTLFAAGLILLFRAARTYPRDVATTLASERQARENHE